jgi:hypothetical protein
MSEVGTLRSGGSANPIGRDPIDSEGTRRLAPFERLARRTIIADFLLA